MYNIKLFSHPKFLFYKINKIFHNYKVDIIEVIYFSIKKKKNVGTSRLFKMLNIRFTYNFFGKKVVLILRLPSQTLTGYAIFHMYYWAKIYKMDVTKDMSYLGACRLGPGLQLGRNHVLLSQMIWRILNFVSIIGS